MFFDLLKTIPQYLISKKGLTTFAGCMADVTNERVKNYLIQHFIDTYQVNMSEALIEDPKAYASFNDFFIRQLKSECRPRASSSIISPVDGCVSEMGPIHKGQLVQAKGRTYSVAELLNCEQSLAEHYVNGQFATLYLSPKDYHRVHLPAKARLLSMNYIPGALFSVQPTTARVVPKLFARNERLAIFFETQIGPMCMVMVGATIVGAIGTSWHGEIKRTKRPVQFHYAEPAFDSSFNQGDEIGYFKLGSTVILLFAEGQKMQWDSSLKAGSAIRFGQAMGEYL